MTEKQPKRLGTNAARREIRKRNRTAMKQKMGPQPQYVPTRLDEGDGTHE
jgi:hypothetical protein